MVQQPPLPQDGRYVTALCNNVQDGCRKPYGNGRCQKRRSTSMDGRDGIFHSATYLFLLGWLFVL
jgi:hypothetical protein